MHEFHAQLYLELSSSVLSCNQSSTSVVKPNSGLLGYSSFQLLGHAHTVHLRYRYIIVLITIATNYAVRRVDNEIIEDTRTNLKLEYLEY